MNLARILRIFFGRYFWLTYLATGLVVAYLVFGAVSAVTADEAPPDYGFSEIPSSRALLARARRKLEEEAPRVPSRDAILQRNIFDSVTGPVDPDAEEEASEERTDAGLTDREKEVVPCPADTLRVLATVVSEENSQWSFASIQEGKEKILCRVGDPIGDRTVAGISWKYLLLEDEERFCYVDIFDEKNMRTRARRRAARRAKRRAARYGDKVEVVARNERVVDRGLFRKLVSNPRKLIRRGRLRPYRVDGKTLGYRFRRAAGKLSLAAFGAQKGDIIERIDG